MCTLQEVYLPLLFLIRHSLELAFKGNIAKIQRMLPGKWDKDFNKEHSLHKLFSFYHRFLQDIDPAKLNGDLAATMDNYLLHYAALNKVLHDLDANSLAFRFPFDSKGNSYHLDFRKVSFYSMLKTLYFTNPFITFSNDVLLEQGILPMHENDYM